MKRILNISLFCLFLSSFSFGQFADQKNIENGSDSATAKPAVLIELFTSEGCQNCPPADLLLEMLGKDQPNENAEIVTLAMHVDYWDRADWRDKYSSGIFSRRQDIYSNVFKLAEIFTPMMVVDGATHFGGAKADKAHKAINKNAKNQKAKIKIFAEEEKVKVDISEIPKHSRSTIYLAIAENELPAGKRRAEGTKYYSVVRKLRSLGMLQPAQDKFSTETFVQFEEDWKKENLKFVVFIQENYSRKVLGVSQINLD